MALTPNFSASQNYGTPNIITLTDTSTGSDATITKRRIYLLQSNGTYLVPTGTTTNYIDWDMTNTTTREPLTIALNVLTQDTALSITVEWLTAVNVMVVNKSISFALNTLFVIFEYFSLNDSPVTIIPSKYFFSK